MRQLILIAGIMLYTLLGATQSSAETTFQGYSQAYQPAQEKFDPPAVSFIDADEQSHLLSDYPGQVLLINFWASWCRTCLHEMASLQRLQQLAGDNVKVLTLNQDLSDSGEIKQLLAKIGAEELPAHRDLNSQLGFALGQTLLPTTLFIDSNGRVAGQLIGPAEWDSPEALALIESLRL
ncbi:MAG: TlpA disulfide reductase family protein [Halopseudomonas sp.]